jgi:hypothetical protein
MGSIGPYLGAAAALTHLSAYAVYARNTALGRVRLNTATWVLWVFLSALNAASYYAMNGDLAKSAIGIAGACACTVTLGWSLLKDRASRIAPADGLALLAGLLAAGAWWHWRSATFANLILQGGFIVSMVPTYRAVFRDPSTERPLPWLMWGTAYLLTLATVALRWRGHLPDLAYPGINLVTHSGVGIVAILLSRRRAGTPS